MAYYCTNDFVGTSLFLLWWYGAIRTTHVQKKCQQLSCEGHHIKILSNQLEGDC